jgi:HEAT repeat protein
MRRIAWVVVVLSVSACISDPRDPNTWIKKLSDPRESKDAVLQLQKLKDPVAVPPLIDLYKKSKDPEVLKAIATFKDKRSVPTLVEALDFTEESCEPTASAASALGDINDPSAADALMKALAKPLPIKTRCNVVKIEAMKALVKMKSPGAVDALIKVLLTSPDEQDFFINQEAARSLGEFADAKAAPALIRGLFMVGRGADIYQPCRAALLHIGSAAVQPLIDAHLHKNAELEADAKKNEFRPGVIEQKTAMVLGDLRAKAAVPTLVADLKKPKVGDNHLGALYALGMIADTATTKDVVAVLLDAKADFHDRTSAAESLNFLDDPSSFPALLTAARTADVVQEGQKYANVRLASAISYARVGGAAEAAAFAPLAAAEKDPTFAECADRLALAKKCNKDMACYAAGFDDPSLPKQEKAAFMMRNFGKAALPTLLKHLTVHEPIVRLALLQSLGRVAERGDATVIKALDAQIDTDHTKSPMRDVVNEMRALKAYLESK